MMSTKISSEHMQRGAVVYVRQSSVGQVLEHKESQRRQYALAETAQRTWAEQAEVQLPILVIAARGTRITWKVPRYDKLLTLLRNPIYAGAYAFGRTGRQTRIVDGRARKTSSLRKPREDWSVLNRDHHRGYISWAQYEKNQTMLSENAHRNKNTGRKSGRGGRALLTGLVRCGRCARMMLVAYGRMEGHAHRYQCRGDVVARNRPLCIGIGGVRVERAVVAQVLQAVTPHAIEAAIEASTRVAQADDDVRDALRHQLEQAKYEASLAERRYQAVDPDKRLVARELETRWEAALAQVRQLQERIAQLDARPASSVPVDLAALRSLAHDLHAAWNAPTADAATKQRIVRIVVSEILLDLDEASNEVLITLHWTGGRHTELRIPRVRGRLEAVDSRPSAVDVVRKIGGQFPDRDMAATMNRMRCTGAARWTTERVRELRERLGIAPFAPPAEQQALISINEAARRLGIAPKSVRHLIHKGVITGTQAMPSAPWRIVAAELDSEVVRLGVRDITARKTAVFDDKNTLRLPGV